MHPTHSTHRELLADYHFPAKKTAVKGHKTAVKYFIALLRYFTAVLRYFTVVSRHFFAVLRKTTFCDNFQKHCFEKHHVLENSLSRKYKKIRK